jgi:hypothetical protein
MMQLHTSFEHKCNTTGKFILLKSQVNNSHEITTIELASFIKSSRVPRRILHRIREIPGSNLGLEAESPG